MTVTFCRDEAPGETRLCMLDGQGRPFRIEISRESERSHKLRLGDRWWVRAVGRMPGSPDWFVETDSGERAVLSPGKAHVTEGLLLPAVVVADSFADKGARLRLDGAGGPTPENPGLREQGGAGPFLDGVGHSEPVSGLAARTAIDAAIEEGLSRILPLAGGGDIAIEAARALTAIDIDRGSNPATSLNLNKLAAQEAARQIGLRGLGGVVVVDFVSMDDGQDRVRLVDSFRSALSAFGVVYSSVGNLSTAGLCEVVLPRGRRPLVDALAASEDEREALDALRAIETAGWMDPGKRIRARIGAGAERWLGRKIVDWERLLASSIGQRWIIEAGVEPRGQSPEVWAER